MRNQSLYEAATPEDMPHAVQPLLSMSGICKSYPGVRALSGARLSLYAGEVQVLMGQNGAGKSTLIKVLTGVERPDAGDILLNGRRIAPQSSLDAQQYGISTVYQEVNLCPNLSVAENMFIGRFPMRGGRIDWTAAEQQARAVLRMLDMDIDVNETLSSYPVAIQQMVAIARAISADAQVLILDEPTSSLDEHEVEQLFKTMRRLKEKGMAILFVTHFLDQTYAVADRITVLRNGEFEGEYAAAELPRLTLINKMVGRDVGHDSASCRPGACDDKTGVPSFLSARRLGRSNSIQPVDLDLRPGRRIPGQVGLGHLEDLLRALEAEHVQLAAEDLELPAGADQVEVADRGLGELLGERVVGVLHLRLDRVLDELLLGGVLRVVEDLHGAGLEPRLEVAGQVVGDDQSAEHVAVADLLDGIAAAVHPHGVDGVEEPPPLGREVDPLAAELHLRALREPVVERHLGLVRAARER